MKNKNTTLLGIAALLGVVGSILNSLFDGDVTTTIDYTVLVPLFLNAIGLIFARDAKPTDPVVTKTPGGNVLVEQAPTVPPSAA